MRDADARMARARNGVIWFKYAEMEMRHRFINHARNLWDRAVTILPRVNQARRRDASACGVRVCGRLT